MPTVRNEYTLSDGRTVVLDVEQGTTQQQVEQYLNSNPDVIASAPQLSATDINPDIMRQSQNQPLQAGGASPLDIATGAGELLTTMGTGSAASALAGLRGIWSAAGEDSPETTSRKIREVQQALTYEPRTRIGQQTVQGVDQMIGEPMRAISQEIGDTAYERYGDSPVAGAAGYTLPSAALSTIGLGGLKGLSSGVKLKYRDVGGEWMPTPELIDALRQRGLTYEMLSPSAKAGIPESLNKGLVPSSRLDLTAKNALIEQAAIGGRQDALAPYKVGTQTLEKDPVSIEALKQGFEPGLVQMVKTANPATRFNMLRMLGKMENLKTNLSGANENRPLNIVGDSLGKRLINLRDVANQRTKDLNNIVIKDLRGKQIDTNIVANRLSDALDKYDIVLKRDADGKIYADYDNSMIVKDPKSQKYINDVIDLLPQDVTSIDAVTAHKIKRQFDALINYGSTEAGGLTDAGKNVMKDVRIGLNDSIRSVSPEYAAVNDDLTQLIGAFNSIQDAVGKKVNIFDPDMNARTLGQEMRTLITNYKRGPMLEQAIKQIDDASVKYGVKADDNLADLVMFANALDKQFGAAVRGGFQGTMDAAMERAGKMSRSDADVTLTGAAFEAGKAGINKLRNINEQAAFKSLEDLIRRGGK